MTKVRAPRAAEIALLAVLHVAALGLMFWSEINVYPKIGFVLVWGLLNFFWLILLRRPGLSAAISLALIVSLILVSRFKFRVIWMTANFIDVMSVDWETIVYTWTIIPYLWIATVAGVLVTVPLAVLIWRFDPFRVRRPLALAGGIACLGGLIAMSSVAPLSPGEAFGNENYVSSFARSGVDAISELSSHGYLESAAVVTDRLRSAADFVCETAAKPPHIILVHDESSFDIRAVNGIKVPAGYGKHFLSFDGKERQLLVEGAGGPSWFTEYNVMTGLSSMSFGRFSFFVTRIAGGRVERGLPRALQRCGYRTFTVYPVPGAFLGARNFYKSAGVEKFLDGADIGGGVFEPDRFYFNIAKGMIDREHGAGPMFLFVYLTANHFPWDVTFHSELTPDWQDPGNIKIEVNEYLRRQAMTERDYATFVARLKQDYPDDAFLIVRYGDHQPEFAKLIVDPAIDVAELGRRLMRFDPRYYTTYYAIDGVNFMPRRSDSALDILDAPYLPLVVQEAAGIPLDPSFAEQKKILNRCKGLFYTCARSSEARRFNRMLIDAGLIKGL